MLKKATDVFLTPQIGRSPRADEIGSYPPGTQLTRDDDDEARFRGPDGKIYIGKVACTELDPVACTFVPRVAEPERRGVLVDLWLRLQHRLGLCGRMRNHDGSFSYMTRTDRDFMRTVRPDLPVD